MLGTRGSHDLLQAQAESLHCFPALTSRRKWDITHPARLARDCQKAEIGAGIKKPFESFTRGFGSTHVPLALP